MYVLVQTRYILAYITTLSLVGSVLNNIGRQIERKTDMILQVRRQKVIDNGNCGSTELITEHYDGSSFVNQNGCMNVDNKKSVILTNYDQLNEITGEIEHFEMLDAFLMNNEGKTIDRIV